MLRLVTALMLPLLLAACAGGTEPTALSAPTGTASEGPATEPTQTVSPPGIDPVEAAVREYVDAANVAMSTGDTTRFRAAVTPECTCLAFADRIDDYRATGTELSGGSWTLEEVSFTEGGSREARAIAVVRSSAYEVTTAGQSSRVPEREASQFVRLTGGGPWLVADVDEL